MKILIISDMVGGPGGAYKYIQQIEDLISSSIEVRVVLDQITAGYVNKCYKFKSVKYIPLSYKFHKDSAIIESIGKLLEEYKPNLVHIVNGSIKSNLLIRKYLISKKIQFISTEQFIDSSLKLEDSVLKEIREINICTNHVIYVSESNKNIACDVFKIIPQKYSIIYNSILPIANKKDNFAKKPFRFYTLARCVPQKGIDTIIKALAKIYIEKIHFDVIGDGEYKTEYLKLADSLFGNRHQFRILGWDENIDYKFLVANYDLFISASRQEGLSYSILEAATSGMPIICSNASGNNELVAICGCGNIFNIDDSDQLSNMLLNFINNPSSLYKKIIKGSKKVDIFFDAKKRINTLEKIYKSFDI